MAGNQRSSSPPGSHFANFKSADEVVAGGIYWLPKKSDLNIELQHSASGNDGHFGHPVVALSVDKQQQNVEVFIVTSLGGKPLTLYPQRHRYLAIHPAKHPDNNSALVLDEQLWMEKMSYVSTRAQHTLPWKMLRPYRDRGSNNKQLRLETGSFAELLKYANLKTTPKDSDSFPAASYSDLFPPLPRQPLSPLRTPSPPYLPSPPHLPSPHPLPSPPSPHRPLAPISGHFHPLNGTAFQNLGQPAAWTREPCGVIPRGSFSYLDRERQSTLSAAPVGAFLNTANFIPGAFSYASILVPARS